MKTLYISYDGLSDNLGGSQIIPYLAGLSRGGKQIHVVSCEKEEKFKKSGPDIKKLLESSGIRWHPLTYHKYPAIISGVWDVGALLVKAVRLHLTERFEVVHCRSYIPGCVGLLLKKSFSINLIFDMRGFWADERVDGNLWDLKKLKYRAIYKFFKRIEISLLKNSDAIVCLTESAKAEMLSWPIAKVSALEDKLWVIPCCVDLDAFPIEKMQAGARKKALGIEGQGLVLGYLGSVGTWYLLDEMMKFFALAKQSRRGSRFLFITPDSELFIRSAARKAGLANEDIIVVSSARRHVPYWLSMVDLGIFFIKPCYSKISSSATKMGEMMASGIPIVANDGVGDQNIIFGRNDIGHLLYGFDGHNFSSAERDIGRLLKIPAIDIRSAAEREFSLSKGVGKYVAIYNSLSNGSSIRAERKDITTYGLG